MHTDLSHPPKGVLPAESLPDIFSVTLRIATRDFNSFFLGAIRGVRFWNRALTAAEVALVFANTIPQDGLVAEYRLTKVSPRMTWACMTAKSSEDCGRPRRLIS